MALRRITRKVLAAVVILLLLGFVLPLFRLQSRRFQNRIADALSTALGRPVTVGDIGLQLFPQPGLILSNFVVQDDPAFSAEPMLRASSVIVRPRLSSLWRSRLEIGTLALNSVSLNLVRSADGHWNIESLLNRAAHTQVAPTARTRPESRPRFPYIEADDARVNFKFGQEKMVWAFVDSNFALWLEAEDLWNARLRGRMVRTDQNLSDTGRVEISGSFRRTDRLRDTPLNVRLTVDRAQLGQLTRLIYNRDRGWRGAVDLNAALTGTPAALGITADVSVDDFRRYDILSRDSLRLGAHCSARYQLQSQALRDVDCRIPEQNGEVTVRGTVTGLLGQKNYDLSVAARGVPLSELVRVARHAKRALPEELRATGNVDAAFTLRSSTSQPPAWVGTGSASEFALMAPTLDNPLEIGTINFSVGESPSLPASRQHMKLTTTKAAPAAGFSVGPFSVPLGGASPLVVEAQLSRSDYQADIHGEADVRRLFALVRSLGGRAPALNLSGEAAVDIAVAGQWSGFRAPVSTGTLQLHNVAAQFRGINEPLRIRSAQVVLAPDEVNVRSLAAGFPNLHMNLGGSFSFPRDCGYAGNCPLQADLHADQVSAEDLNRLLNPRLRKRAWYELGSSYGADPLLKLQASGRLAVDRVLIKSVVLNHASAQLQLSGGRLELNNLHGDLLGGKYHGTLEASFTGRTTPDYLATGSVERASMAQVASLMKDDWATGSLNADFRIAFTGSDGTELLRTASGTIAFELRDGMLPHLRLAADTEAVRVKRLWGHGAWRNSRLEIGSCKLQAPSGLYTLTGTAGQQLDLNMIAGSAHGYTVSGTLDKPRVAVLPTSATQASLKP